MLREGKSKCVHGAKWDLVSKIKPKELSVCLASELDEPANEPLQLFFDGVLHDVPAVVEYLVSA